MANTMYVQSKYAAVSRVILCVVTPTLQCTRWPKK